MASNVFFPDFPADEQDNSTFKATRASKVTIVGVGQVGMACAYSILTQNIAKEIVLADVMREKLEGEVLDLQHAGNFLPAKITAASADYQETAGSDVIVITAGVRQREGESRLQLMGRNVDVLKGMIPQLVKLSPDTIFLVVTNPCDALSYITYKLSGLPPHRVIGSGTALDSSRFRTLLANRFNVNPQSVHGWILGEHGDSSVAVWSTVNIGGVPVAQMFAQDASLQEELNAIHQKVIASAGEVIKLKGYTNWAIGAAVASIVRCILNDERRVIPLSTLATGRYGISEDIYIALPCVLGRHGIVHTLNVPLQEDEIAKLRHSAKTLNDVKVI